MIRISTKIAIYCLIHNEESLLFDSPTGKRLHAHTHTQYLLISSLPKAAHNKDNRDWRLEVCADGLDVDEKLPPLTGLDDRNPQHRHHHQHEHKHPAQQITNQD